MERGRTAWQLLLAHAFLLHHTLAALPAAVTCPAGWQHVRGRCFWMSETEHTFESCQRDVCGKYGATLACLHPDDSSPLAYKFSIGYSDQLFAAWIGFTNARNGKDWEWINGCPKTWSHWVQGEPNNFCGGENCAAINGVSGGWMDLSCRLRFPCLCENPATLIPTYNLTVAGFRDDTCYAGCGGVTKWCSAWPFLRLYDVDDDVCHWETVDGQRRGKGVTECAKRVAKRADCSPYLSYSVGRCGCAPAKGKHVNCTLRAKDATSDIFAVTTDAKGIPHQELVASGQRCAYTKPIDEEYFVSLRPALNTKDMIRIWARVAFIWLALGVPSFLLMFFVLIRMCCRSGASFTQFQDDDPFEKSADGEADRSAGGEAAYGPLIDGTDPASAEAVNRWIFRGAFGAIVYGIALMCLGVTLAIHMSGSDAIAAPEALELLEALIMCFSKAMVTRAACMVHCRLSPVARQLAGPWVLVFAMVKLLGAVSALGVVLVFSALAQRDFETICLAIYLFRWSLLMALPLESLAGFAIWRVQVRAEPYAGGEARVGGWVTSMVVGNFGAGTAVWWAGYLGAVHEADMAMGGCFVLAAFSQLIAGTSLMLVNRKIKMHFKQPAQRTAEQQSVAATEIGRSPDTI